MQHVICSIDEIPEREARGYILDSGENIFITQRDGQFYAYKNNCPHLNVELEFLENDFLDSEQEYIECSTHGARFNVEDGVCVFGPCEGQALSKVKISIQNNMVYLAS